MPSGINDVVVGSTGIAVTIVTTLTEGLLSASTTHEIDVKQPDGTETTWAAAPSGVNLVYETGTNDLNQIGDYFCTAHVVTADGHIWYGKHPLRISVIAKL